MPFPTAASEACPKVAPVAPVDTARPGTWPSPLRDALALTKPRITALVITTTAGGLWLAPGRCALGTTLATLAGVALLVGGANALNMYAERDADLRMRRTAGRPLPAGRMTPAFALTLGLLLSVLSLPVLAFGANVTTVLLGAFAHLSYVLVYTPLKQRTHRALFIGAIAGAMPPLLGATAAAGAVTLTGGVLFGILYFWQVPHFLAISVFRQDEYERAGFVVMPTNLGLEATRRAALRYSAGLLATSLLLIPLRVVHPWYGPVAALAGVTFGLLAARGLGRDPIGWARVLFIGSLVYLPLLFGLILVSAR